MTDPITPVAAARGLQVSDPHPPAEASPPPPAATPAEPKRQPLSLDVTRSDGVFVYTLRDPATDVVLAVIPREAVQTGRDGRNLDERV